VSGRERRRRAQDAARKARYRQRLRDGAAVLPLTVRDFNGLIEMLVNLEWLTPAESESRVEIVRAAEFMLNDAIARRDAWTDERPGPWHG
jgi:hypothetical protein